MTSPDAPSRQFDGSKESAAILKLARESRRSPATIRRCVWFARGVDRLESIRPDARAIIIRGDSKLTKGFIRSLGRLNDADFEDQGAVERLVEKFEGSIR